MIKNKKAEATITEEMGYWIPRLVFVIITALSIYILTSIFIQTEISVLNTDAELLSDRLLYSSYGISYYDPLSNRIYPGIIDISKLKDTSILEKAIFYGDKSTYLGAKITLTDNQGNIIGESIYNNNAYRRIAEKGLKGKGGVELKEKEIYVLARDDKGNLKNTNLKISTVISRS